MNQLYTALLELQNLDREIAQAQTDLQKFDPQLAETEAPLKSLENEISTTRIRLADVRQQATRLESGAASKRDRLQSYQGRLDRVRNAREEAAVRTEMDLVRSALDADEQEALEAMENARRTDLRLDDLEKQLIRVRAEVEPKREELLAARKDAEAKLATLLQQRAQHAAHIDAAAMRLYERVRSGRNKASLAPLTADGACGNCFNVLPLQEQSEVRRGTTLHRCEACGVILYPQDEAA